VKVIVGSIAVGTVLTFGAFALTVEIVARYLIKHNS